MGAQNKGKDEATENFCIIYIAVFLEMHHLVGGKKKKEEKREKKTRERKSSSVETE